MDATRRMETTVAPGSESLNVRSWSITRQARGLSYMAITAMGRRIARNGRVSAVRRTDTAL